MLWLTGRTKKEKRYLEQAYTLSKAKNYENNKYKMKLRMHRANEYKSRHSHKVKNSVFIAKKVELNKGSNL